ncbi:MAG TPA: 30S ribosomal protein S8 [Thermoplasmatales archaeon]|nr:30S ribosomal protein S8 [Thermoplasmatales archaeon]HEX17640.1 30S ribosomal protein S8 [Thermoplasmatales archaeon]
MQHDPLADAMSSIKNAEMKGKRKCIVKPASKLIGNVLSLMKEEGYIKGFEFVDDHKAGYFEVELKGAINDCGAIKPRYPVKSKDMGKWESRYLPARDFGILILTTNQGVISNKKAKELGIGGKLLAFVY